MLPSRETSSANTTALGAAAAVTAQRRWGPSSFDFVMDDDSSPPLGLRDTPSGELPHTAQYLFNSMPCAYTWFHH